MLDRRWTKKVDREDRISLFWPTEKKEKRKKDHSTFSTRWFTISRTDTRVGLGRFIFFSQFLRSVYRARWYTYDDRVRISIDHDDTRAFQPASKKKKTPFILLDFLGSLCWATLFCTPSDGLVEWWSNADKYMTSSHLSWSIDVPSLDRLIGMDLFFSFGTSRSSPRLLSSIYHHHPSLTSLVFMIRFFFFPTTCFCLSSCTFPVRFALVIHPLPPHSITAFPLSFIPSCPRHASLSLSHVHIYVFYRWSYVCIHNMHL